MQGISGSDGIDRMWPARLRAHLARLTFKLRVLPSRNPLPRPRCFGKVSTSDADLTLSADASSVLEQIGTGLDVAVAGASMHSKDESTIEPTHLSWHMR